MNPEENELLLRALRLSEENNQILKKIQSRAKWAFVWGVIKIAIIVIPLVLGYVYLSPYFGEVSQGYENLRGVVEVLSR